MNLLALYTSLFTYQEGVYRVGVIALHIYDRFIAGTYQFRNKFETSKKKVYITEKNSFPFEFTEIKSGMISLNQEDFTKWKLFGKTFIFTGFNQ